MSQRMLIRPIWFFVGLILLSMGMVVLVAGIIQWVQPPATSTMLAHLHPNLWWGGLMMFAGALFTILNRKPVEH